MAANELAGQLQHALDAHQLHGITLGPNCAQIHSLMFADDLIVCGRADTIYAQIIKQCLHHFCNISGQTPNWNKSSIC